MSNSNYYYYNGAFCENCGFLTGSVQNNGVDPIWHDGCKPDCKLRWENQLSIVSDDEETLQEIIYVQKENKVDQAEEKNEKSTIPVTPEYRHAYHEDDEDLEREAREEYEREMEEQNREEEEMEKRMFEESRYRYIDSDEYDSD
jgi:hypothetical protein